MNTVLLYGWESYSFRNYPLYGLPRVQHRSLILRTLQWLWAHIARLVDRYRCVHVSAHRYGSCYEYSITLCDRGIGASKNMSADQMLQVAEFLAKSSNRRSLQLRWSLGTFFEEVVDVPRWAIPHLRHGMMRAVFHHLNEEKNKSPKTTE